MAAMNREAEPGLVGADAGSCSAGEHQGGSFIRWRVVGPVVGITAILAIHVLGRVAAYCSPIRADSYVFSSFGYRMAHGEVLYRDMSDAKPPGIFLLNAAVYLVADGGREALIPIESLFMLLGYFALYKIGADLYGRAVGLVLALVGALAINFFLLADYAVEGFNLAENYMVVVSAAAVLCYRRAYRSDRVALFLLTGALLGLGSVLKQTVLPLAAAILAHRTLWCLIADKRVRAGGRSCLDMLAGAGAVCLPFVLMVIVQGTAAEALAAVTRQAATRLARATAWPGQWEDIMPLGVPMAWCAIGLLLWARSFVRLRGRELVPGRTDTGHTQVIPGPMDVSFLLIWLSGECAMLWYLPQRAFHYYVLSCLPLILCSGLIWAMLRGVRQKGESQRVRVVLAAVAIWSIAFARPAIDTLVPTAIARYRSYDAAADRAFFEEALRWGQVDFG
jgi:hypothetical protein